jgi:hypothetical protein
MVTQVVDGRWDRALKLVPLSRRTAVSTEDEGNLMVNKLMAPAKWAMALALVLPTTGCLAAAAAAGAGAGIYLTSRGAESMVASSVDQVAARARQVMNEEGIVPDASSMEKGGDKREFKGKKGDLDITIDIERKDAKTTRVEVTARKNLAEWDKAYAQHLLEKIVQKS